MFNYFHKNKFRYENGQLVPIFIVVLTVLIIMAMLTINLAKIGTVKTDSGNAADAGALAGGSVMAGVFNAQAIANSQMMVNYQMFFAEMGALTAITIIAAIKAATSCSVTCTLTCPDACGSPTCTTAGSIATKSIIAQMVSVIAFHVAQAFTYMSMGKQAEQGRKQAIEMAYRYAFINSGIGNKLISGSPPTDAADKRGDDNNYSETFNNFVKSEAVTSGNYTWTDGQDRKHQVHVEVNTQDIDNYKLKYAALPTAAIVIVLKMLLFRTGIVVSHCIGCPCSVPIISGWAFLDVPLNEALVMAGLLPAWETDESTAMTIVFPLCWVVDINHDRRLTVTTWQEHGQQDYGLWQATYPHVESKSVVSFKGAGKIYPPNPHFDTDIIETD